MASRCCPQPHGRTLADILPQLAAVSGTLVQQLQEFDSVSNARLAFRGLRDLIDGAITRVHLTVRPADPQRWAARQLPSLGRWPRLNDLSVTLDAEAEVEDTAGLTAMATLPLLGMSSAARRRITSLTLYEEDLHVNGIEAVIPPLALLLPNLQDLDLGELSGVSFKRDLQQLMFDSLATLRHLRSLSLPGTGLAGVEALATNGVNLTRLVVLGSDEEHEDQLMDDGAVASISQLQQLKELSIKGVEAAGSGKLLELMKCLPPSLELLEYQPAVPDVFGAQLTMALPPGRPPRLTLSCFRPTAEFARLAHAILACPPVRSSSSVELLEVQTVLPTDGDLLDDLNLAPLWALIRRCQRVHMGFLLTNSSSWPAAAQVVGLLGLPQELSYRSQRSERLWFNLNCRRSASQSQEAKEKVTAAEAEQLRPDPRSAIVARISGGGGGEPRLAADGEASAVPALLPPLPPAPPPPPPSASEFGRAALQRLTSSGTPCSATGAPQGLTRRMLLLRGPALAALAQTPDLLHWWMRWLDGRAAEVAAAVGAGDGGSKRIARYQVLPAAAECPSVLVQCTQVAGASAALAAAVAAVAEAPGAAGTLEATEAVCQTVSHATPVDVVRRVLQEELQALWDRHVGSCGGNVEAGLSLLRGLLRLWDALVVGMQPQVDM